MMMRSSSVLLAAMLLGSSATAMAQGPGQPPATHGFVNSSDLSMEMGRCALLHNRAAATAVLMAASEDDQTRALNHLRPTLITCLAGRTSATMDSIHVEGAMAEQLLGEEHGALLNRAERVSPVAPQRVAAGEGAWRTTLACAVAADPVHAVAMLRQLAASPEEIAAFRQLGPQLQACAPASGAITLRPASIRATVAAITYRLATGTAPLVARAS